MHPTEPRRSERLKQQSANFLDTEDLDTELTVAMVSTIDKIIDPPSVEAAKKLDDWLECEVSIKNELDIHKRLKTGILVKPPPNINIVGSRIILHYKLDKDGKIGSHKFQLIAQGFTQQEGINFTDTFSPTAKLTAVRITAAIAVRNDWELEQTDIDAAYLNASLKEDIYMCQPKSFEEPGQEEIGRAHV